MSEAEKQLDPESATDGAEGNVQVDQTTPVESEDEGQSPEEKRYALLQSLVQRETYIDRLDGEEMARAYSLYDRSPEKIVDALVGSFQNYCRKCIREVAIMKVKNELALMKIDEAEGYKVVVVDKAYGEIKDDPALEQLLMMMLFKNRFWTWSYTGLKEIFNELREQPGHQLNSFFNLRFHKMKDEKKFQKVGDLVTFDVTVIVNEFKARIIKKDCTIF
ncbi:MAG: hypothetical protein GY786_24870 [Proteobacteria bacterium]|nr:hypothetical protein [Pseudomonadota bacterium]